MSKERDQIIANGNAHKGKAVHYASSSIEKFIEVMESRGYVGVRVIKIHPEVNCQEARRAVLKAAQAGECCWEYEGDYDATVGKQCAIWDFEFDSCTSEGWKNDYGCRSM